MSANVAAEQPHAAVNWFGAERCLRQIQRGGERAGTASVASARARRAQHESAAVGAGLIFRLDPTDEEVVHSPRCLSGFGADLQVDRLPFHVLCFVRGNKRDEFTDHIGS